MTTCNALTPPPLQAQAEVITAATLTWRQWHLNYYHGLGESVFEVHSLACKWLGYCGAANSTDLAPIFIERPGDQASWAQFLPAAESALKCLFPGPNHFIGDDRIRDKVPFVLLKAWFVAVCHVCQSNAGPMFHAKSASG